jgi:hypothetical protein
MFTSNKLGSITQTFVLLGFLQGLTSMTTNLDQQQQGVATFLVIVFERGKENHFSHGESLF